MHPGPELVHHLLVQLADAPAGGAGLALQEDGVEAAVRDRAATGDGDDTGVPPALDDVGEAVPGHAGLELRELVGGVGAGKHAQDALERLPGESLERCGPADGLEELVHGEPLRDRHRDQLLGEHVERVARHRRLLDGAVAHAAHDDRGLEEVAAVLGKDDALAGLADLVAGPADALQPAGDRRGAFHLDHEVHGAHVDAELEAAGGDDGGQPAGLELLLDLEALLAGDAAVVGSHQLLACQLVEALGQALREAAAVGEDDGAVMGPDQLQDPGMDGRPDAVPLLPADDGATGLLVLWEDLAQARHVLHGHHDLEFQRLAGAGIHDRDIATVAGAAEEARDGLEGALGGGEADALEWWCVDRAQALQPFQAQGQVGAALAAGDGVDLVHDHVLDAAQDLARLAGEQQVEALRRGDEDVRRALDEVPALVRGRVAGAGGDRDPRRLLAQPLRRQGDPGQRRPEVALHVVGQRLEGADIQDPDRSGLGSCGLRPRLPGEAVQAPQERGEGLAAASGRVDQRAAARRDRRPALDLSGRGGLERRLEPGPHGGPEGRERIGDARWHGTASIEPWRHLVQMFDSPLGLRTTAQPTFA